MSYSLSLTPKLIYVFRINDEAHSGCLKIGDTIAEGDVSIQDLLIPNSKALNTAARERINQYTKTAGISYDLLYTELTAYFKGKEILAFRDNDVHMVLERSGIKKKVFQIQGKANDWYATDLETVKKAIAAVKAGRQSLQASEITTGQSPIDFRPEQKDAIEKTKKQFKKNNQMLWYAKMRFGKTLSALQVVKDMKFRRTLILTHRPAVNDGWFEDFNKIFYDREDYTYGSKSNGESFGGLERMLAHNADQHYVYFASMQDLRGSEAAGGRFDKNNELFSASWDLIIVDEAHEGTKTELGKNVLQELTNPETKVLHLSGTPFNLLDDYREEEIYTWDYVMEQKAKADWFLDHPGDYNPYEALPRLNIFTFDLGKILSDYADEDVAFNFHEFFRVDENGGFIHKADVERFLNLICQEDDKSNYPYSTSRNRDNFRHSFWRVPGVKEAKALSSMLQEHRIFGQFQIINVAGDGDDDAESEAALKMVKDAIGPHPDETYTITLSCGRLSTGVSVPAWTAVFMLAGSFNTSAASYMQTIFRCQTPATINGKVKTECFVFDFAPDRTLKVIAETAKISAKVGKTTGDDRKIIGDFLNFCPVISLSGTRMAAYNVDKMLEQLKKVYVERVVRNGFEDSHLYNNDMLMKLDGVELEEFDGLKKIIGSTKAMPKSGDIEINNQGFSEEEYEEVEEAEAKKRKKEELTEAEKNLLEAKKEKKKNRDSAISILRGISIRMPLMIYGAELKNESSEITIDNFTELIDPQSWEEFMPKGVSKQKFNSFKKYYEPDVFRAAGRRIRATARAADALSIEERVERITAIFNTFRNPDKETVLTPWRVVNMHMSDCLGGWTFYDEKFESVLQEPRFVDQGQVTADVFASGSHILEINSKSGLYPLYMAYGIYRTRLKEDDSLGLNAVPTLEMQRNVWDKVIAENIFVLCKTPMAKSITKRTLCGFRNGKVNAHYFEDLVNMLKNKSQQFIDRVTRRNYWNLKGNDKMKFDAVVGNPPYQQMDGGHGVSATPLYNLFVEKAKALEPKYLSMIIPSRWFSGGKYLDDFRKSMLNDDQLSVLFDYETSAKLFPGVDIAGGVCYFLWEKGYHGKCRVTNCINDRRMTLDRTLDEYSSLIRSNQAVSILQKVIAANNRGKFLADTVSARKPFGMPTNYQPHKTGVPCWFIQKIGLQYAKPDDVQDPNGYLPKWKFLIPKAPIAGQTDFSKPVGFYYDGNIRIAKPGECCTESWIIAGNFDSKDETLSFKSYLFTKVVRFLILQTVVSQDVTKKNFRFVPDLGKYSGEYTDEQLCKHWNITQEEWNYIDSKIK